MDNPQENLYTYIFIGRSGCGKGTQAQLLIEHLKEKGVISDKNPVFYLETGNRFRTFVAGTGHSSRLAKKIMDESKRQPDFMAVWVWSNELVDNIMGDEHIIFDGTPRSLLEAQVLDTALSFYGRVNPTIVYLEVSREESKRRLEERKRGDDSRPGDIDKRLDWFDRDVLPAVEYYRNNPKYKFVEVDGEQTVEKIHDDLIALLEL